MYIGLFIHVDDHKVNFSNLLSENSSQIIICSHKTYLQMLWKLHKWLKQYLYCTCIFNTSFPGGIIIYGALWLFDEDFVHVVSITFTALILTELLMVALTIRTWHWAMAVAEVFSLAIYIASLIVLRNYFGKFIIIICPQDNELLLWIYCSIKSL